MGSSRDKIFYVGPSTHTWDYGKFVNARYAHFTNSNAKLRLRLRLHLDFITLGRYVLFSSVKWSQLEIIGEWFPHVLILICVGPDKRTRAKNPNASGGEAVA